MANGYIEVSKREPCPICGTGDYCCHIPAEDGYGEVWVCKRFTDSRVINPGGDTPGKTNGNFYLFIAESHQGYGIYRDANEVAMAEANGFHIYRKGDNDSDVKYGAAATEKELVPVGINEVTNDSKLDLFYRGLIAKYPLTKTHEAYLRREGWSDKLIKDTPLASIPVEDWRRGWHKRCDVLEPCYLKYRATITKELIDEFGEEPVGVPGFYQNISKKDGSVFWTFNSRSGIVFPLFNAKGQIIRLRIRMDFIDAAKEYKLNEKKELYFIGEDNKKRFVSVKGVQVEEFDGTRHAEKDEKYRGKGKYRNMSSYVELKQVEEGTYTNKFLNGTESGNQCGLYCHDDDNFLIAIASEGEKKAIRGNDALKMPGIDIPGVSSYDKLFTTRIGKNILEKLRNRGTQYIAVAFDADKFQNKMVMDAEHGFVNAILSSGFKAIVASWDTSAGKGLDDAINSNARLEFKEITNENITSFYY